MPVELEYKYLVDVNQVFFDDLCIILKNQNTPYTSKTIEQRYFPKTGRLRKISQENMVDRYIFTFKHNLSYIDGDLEIETDISKEDFDLGWRDCSHDILKNRITFSSGNHIWEIDFFKSPETGNHNLIIIECEVNKDKPDISCLPAYIRNNILYQIPIGNHKFSNKNLSFQNNIDEIYKTYGKK